VPDTQTTDRQVAVARSRAAWADLRERLSTATPAAVGRAVLGVAVLAVVVSLIAGTWPVLLPFVVGGLLAYAILPVVDALDKVMPRALAATISMLAVVAGLIAVVVIVVPPLVTAAIDLGAQIPRPDQIDDLLDDLMGALPDSAQDVVEPILVALAGVVRDGLAGASGGLDALVPVILDAALGVAGAVFGLLVLPAWLLTIMATDRRRGAEIDRRLAGWLRPDFWAIVRMLDRAAGTYLRGFVVVAIAVGALTYAGLSLSPQLDGPDYRGALALAVFAGTAQLVPELGLILGFIPAVLLAVYGPERAVVYVAIYLVARWLAGALLGGRLLEDRLRVHRAILIPGVVVLSQLGPLWLLLSAPILAFGTDLVRYLHGRLSEPPRPAGILPGEPLPSAYIAAQQGVTPRPTSSVYRRRPTDAGMAARTTSSRSPTEPTTTSSQPATR
jgi:predicted PurR-regulated permease PerM